MFLNSSTSADDRAADDEPLDLVRSFVDLTYANVAVDPLDRKIRDIAVATVHLDRIRAHTLRHFRCKKLRHRRFLEAWLARIAQRRSMPDELPCRFDSRCHVGQHEIYRLVFDEGFAEARSLRC